MATLDTSPSQPARIAPRISAIGSTWPWLGIALLLLSIPVLLTRTLPLTDLPNHQARIWELAFLDRTPELAQFLQIHWRPVPLLALDLTLPWLLPLLGVEGAARAYILAMLVLLGAGLVMLNRALAPENPAAFWAPWPLAGLLLFYNKVFVFGFLNYLGALAFGLIVLALSLRRREWNPVLAFLSVTAGSAIVLIAHLHAFGCIAVAAVAAEAGRQFTLRAQSKTAFAGIAITALPFAIALAGLYLLPGRYSVLPVVEYKWLFKAQALTSLFALYNRPAELAATVAVLALGALGLRRGWLRAAPETGFMVGALMLLWLLLPTRISDSTYADYRIPVLAAWLAVAGTSLRLPARRHALAGGLLVTLMAAQSGWLALRWHDYQLRYDKVDAVLARVAPGSRVLVTLDREQEGMVGPRLIHAPMRAVWQRHAFVSGQFFNGGVPVQPRPELAFLATEPIHEPAYRLGHPEVDADSYVASAIRSGYDSIAIVYPGRLGAALAGRLACPAANEWLMLCELAR